MIRSTEALADTLSLSSTKKISFEMSEIGFSTGGTRSILPFLFSLLFCFLVVVFSNENGYIISNSINVNSDHFSAFQHSFDDSIGVNATTNVYVPDDSEFELKRINLCDQSFR